MSEVASQDNQVLPAPAPVPALPGTRRSPIFVELAWLVFLVWIYNWVQDLAPLRRKQAFNDAQGILSLEKGLHLDPESALDHWLAHQHALAFAASNFYAIAIFLVTFGFAAWLWWRRPDIYRPLRNYIVLANIMGFAVFWLYPVAPPRMLQGYVDVVLKVGGLGWHNTLVQHADQLAAMPSMHLGYAVWCSLAAWQLAGRRATKVLALVFGIGYPLITALDVMATGNHYLLDVVAGSVTTFVAVAAVELVTTQVGRLRAGQTAGRPLPGGVSGLLEPGGETLSGALDGVDDPALTSAALDRHKPS